MESLIDTISISALIEEINNFIYIKLKNEFDETKLENNIIYLGDNSIKVIDVITIKINDSKVILPYFQIKKFISDLIEKFR